MIMSREMCWRGEWRPQLLYCWSVDVMIYELLPSLLCHQCFWILFQNAFQNGKLVLYIAMNAMILILGRGVGEVSMGSICSMQVVGVFTLHLWIHVLVAHAIGCYWRGFKENLSAPPDTKGVLVESFVIMKWPEKRWLLYANMMQCKPRLHDCLQTCPKLPTKAHSWKPEMPE